MPSVYYPHKDEPGYVTARRCTAPCGGWVVLYDRTKGGLAALRDPISVTGRYVVVHKESRKWAGVAKRADAMAYLMATAKGEDVLGILPRTVQAPAEVAMLVDPPPPLPLHHDIDKRREDKRQKTGGGSLAGEGDGAPSVGSVERPRACASGEPVAAAAPVPDALAFQRAMAQRFGVERLAEEVEAGLTAEKVFLQNGDMVRVADHATRVKYLDLLFKYRIGQPDKREKALEPKRISRAELDGILKRSPAARQALRRNLERIERGEDTD